MPQFVYSVRPTAEPHHSALQTCLQPALPLPLPRPQPPLPGPGPALAHSAGLPAAGGPVPGERLGQAALPGLAPEDRYPDLHLPAFLLGEGLPVSMVRRENHVFEKQTPDPTGSRQPRPSTPGRRATLPLTGSQRPARAAQPAARLRRVLTVTLPWSRPVRTPSDSLWGSHFISKYANQLQRVVSRSRRRR